jgi:hypothetical protein
MFKRLLRTALAALPKHNTPTLYQPNSLLALPAQPLFRFSEQKGLTAPDTPL